MIREYLRNLRHGPIVSQLRQFVIGGIVAADIQMGLLWAFIGRSDFHYLVGAVIAIEITIILSYVLSNAWTWG